MVIEHSRALRPYLTHLSSFQIFNLNYRKERLEWECDNFGQQWNSTNFNMTFTEDTTTGTLMPNKFCEIGIHQTYLIFVFALLVDFVLLTYGRPAPFSPSSRYRSNSVTDLIFNFPFPRFCKPISSTGECSLGSDTPTNRSRKVQASLSACLMAMFDERLVLTCFLSFFFCSSTNVTAGPYGNV